MKNYRLATFGLFISLLLSINTLAAPAEKDWTMLVYLNGINSLDSFGPMNINQMEEMGSSAHLNIVVEWGSLQRNDVQRLLIKKDSDPQNVTSPVVQNIGSVDMGDPEQLVNFVDWAHQNYPAKHYFIVVWNHGGGWHFVKDTIRPMDISYDDRSGHAISTAQLGVAMEQSAKIIGHKVDIYGSDACLMGMIEVASQMANSVNYFVGSQDLEPGQGWPYSSFLQKWNAGISTLQPADVATLLSKEYLSAYSGGIYGHSTVTMSALDLSKIAGYNQAVADFASELSSLSSSQRSKIQTAAKRAKYFYMEDYRDMTDFINQLSETSVQVRSGEAVKSAQSQLVLSNDQNQGQNTFGLSVWLPVDGESYKNFADKYQSLDFNRDSNWGAFVKNLLNL